MWRRIATLQLYCIASIISILITLSQSSTPPPPSSSSSSSPTLLAPRKSYSHSYDPYIICELEGPTHGEGLPANYNHQVYAELLTLCSSAHGSLQNVGCFCTHATGQVHCDRDLADQGLWSALYNADEQAVIDRLEADGVLWGDMSFPDLCKYGCECKNPDDARRWFRQTFHGDEYDMLSGINGLVPQQSSGQGTGGGGSGSATFAAGTVAAGPFKGGGVVQPAKHEIQWQNQCGNDCSSAKDCGVPQGGGSKCSCQAHSSQYQPGAGTVAFVAACLVTLGSGGGKREEGLPCPCNSTYVSHGCCSVLDGIVWEPPESNLGSLADNL